MALEIRPTTKHDQDMHHPAIDRLVSVVLKSPELILPVGQVVSALVQPRTTTSIEQFVTTLPWPPRLSIGSINEAQEALRELYCNNEPNRHQLDSRRAGFLHTLTLAIGPLFVTNGCLGHQDPTLVLSGETWLSRLDVVFADNIVNMTTFEGHECKVNIYRTLIHPETGALERKEGRHWDKLRALRELYQRYRNDLQTAIGYTTLTANASNVKSRLSDEGFEMLFVVDRSCLLSSAIARFSALS